MLHVIAESRTGVEDPKAPASLEGARKKTGPQDERSFVLSLIKHPGEPVLDVGTGDCACLATILGSQGTQVVALDKDRKTIHAAGEFLDTRRVRKTVRLLQDDITASSLASDSFQNIVCFNVLHHISRFDGALAELRRILASGGRVIISEYDENQDGFLGRLERAVNRHFRSVAAYRRPSGRLVLSCEK